MQADVSSLLKCNRSLVGVDFGFPRACSDEDAVGGDTLNRRLQLGFEAGRLNGIEEGGHGCFLPCPDCAFQHLLDTLIPRHCREIPVGYYFDINIWLQSRVRNQHLASVDPNVTN